MRVLIYHDTIMRLSFLCLDNIFSTCSNSIAIQSPSAELWNFVSSQFSLNIYVCKIESLYCSIFKLEKSLKAIELGNSLHLKVKTEAERSVRGRIV